ncbi:hypothetical protein [Amycolatopsis sp. cmx-11-51]|uniref:WXG100-like domain-containing protein n=1 Tax=Amycolatopsis sp. cmx-11-51 TaxID=2785797 RepID=UPI0039E23560
MPIKVDRSDFGDVPEWARTLLEVLGVSWPAANQHKFRRVAQEYDLVTEQLAKLPDDIARVKRGIDQKLSMPQGGEAFDKSMKPLTGGTPNLLGELAEGTKGIADGCRKVALDVEYTKFSAIGQLFLLAYEIAMEYALASVTAGASLANLTWHYALTRGYLLVLFKMLVRAIVFEMFIGITGGLIIDAAVQRLQRERTEWDDETTKQTAISGAIGGLLGGAVGELGERLGRKVGALLGKDFGKIATDDLLKLVKDLKLPGGDELADNWVRDLGRTLTDRAGKQLTDPATAFTKRAIEGFSDEVADRFGTAFGKTLGDDAARQLGRDYARTFVDNWGKRGLDGTGAFGDSLRRALDPHSDKIGKDAVDLLTGHVPEVLSRNVNDRLGGNLAARAAEFSTTFLFEGVSGVMSQATMAALNGESVSAAEYGMGFVGGVVGGAVSHKLEGIGERGLDAAITSMKEKFGGVGSLGDLSASTTLDTKSGTDPATVTAPATATTGTTGAATTSDVKSTSDTRTSAGTKVSTETKSTSDSKVAKPESDVKPAKTAAEAKQPDAKTVRTTSDSGSPADEERPRTRPSPLRTTSTEETAAPQAPAQTESSAVEAETAETVTTDQVAEVEAPEAQTEAPEPEAEPEPLAPVAQPEAVAQPDEQVLVLADLPPFLADGQALGSAPVLAVEGVEELRDELGRLLPGVTPDRLDAIGDAVRDDFESTLSGLHFPLRTAEGWREVTIRAAFRGDVTSEPKEKTKADLTVQSGITNSENMTVLHAGDVGMAGTVQAPVGPYGTVGGKVALAAPGVAQTVTVSTSDQRAIRSGEGSRRVVRNVEFTLSVHDQDGAEVDGPAEPVPGSVTLRLPDDLVGITPPSGVTATNLEPRAGRGLRNPVPEAVTGLGDVFTDTAGLLHGSVTALDAPGREALRAFLGTASVREHFGAMLEGWVTSPALLSSDGDRVGAVRMKAVLARAELVGPTTGTQLRLHESATTGSAVSASTKRGFDASAAVGGGGTVGGARVAAGVGGGFSSRTGDTTASGRSSTTKAGIQLKSDIGLYRFDAEIVVQALDGRETPSVTATVYARVGMAEAVAQGLPVPAGTGTGITPPDKAKFQPAHLAAGLAAGNVRVGRFEGADGVSAEIRARLAEVARYADLLPGWDGHDVNAAQTLEMLANERRLQAALSPLALRNRMDALLGAGVSVTLNRQGDFRQDRVTITVRLEQKSAEHRGQVKDRVVRNATTTSPALGASSSSAKGWSVGPEGKVTVGAGIVAATLGIVPTFAAKYGRATTTRTGGGPTVDSTYLNIGSPDSQVFEHTGRFVVSITAYSRAREVARKTLPGLPGTQVPHVRPLWTTPDEDQGPYRLPVTYTLLTSDSVTLPADPGRFAPGAPRVRTLDPPRSIIGHFQALAPPDVGEWVGVEAIAHTGHVSEAAMAALVEASDGDQALTLPGSDAWASVQTMLSTENIKAALSSFTHGTLSTELVYPRRLADRVGRIGVVARLSNPVFVRVADDAGAERSTAGGYRFESGKSKSSGPAVTAGVAITGAANDDPASSGTGGVTGKPWAKTTTKGEGLDISASVDRNVTTAAGTPRVLARFDIAFTVLAEARQQTVVVRPEARGAARFVDLPGAAFVWLTEDQARRYGLLPAEPRETRKRPERLAAPTTLPPFRPGALGLGAIERLPDLSDLVPELTARLSRHDVPLLPGRFLDDAMNNWARLTDLVSPDGVQALVDSALDGGIPLQAHLPKLFTDRGFQVLLTARVVGEPAFREVVNDGRTIEHSTARAIRTTRTEGTAKSWSAALRLGGQEKFSGGATATSVGGAVTDGVGVTKTTSVNEVTSRQDTRLRTGTGPAALFDVPIQFTLEVRRDGRFVAAGNTGKKNLAIRLLADNLTPGAGAFEKSGPARLSRRDALPGELRTWRRGGVAKLPETASVESVRAAARLREVVRDTLTLAGADSGITGYGTGTINALWSALSPQVLQAFLPSMTSESLPVPALREAAVLRGKRADVEVHARLTTPRLVALSDGVNLESPANATTARSAERKTAEVGEVTVGGPSVVPVKESANIGGLFSGAETRWADEPAVATTDGTTVSAAANLKPAGRTALVRFDVDYRIVVKVGGRTEVVDLALPASADVRMPVGDLTDVTGQKVSRLLKARQGRVARTAKSWREAEVGAQRHRLQAHALIRELGVGIDWPATVAAARAERPGRLEERHHKYARRTEQALREAENLAEAARTRLELVRSATDALQADLEAMADDVDDLAREAVEEAEVQRAAATDEVARTQAVLQAAWLDLTESKQDAWWLAKGALDAEFTRLAAQPGSPEDEAWRHSRATDAPWFTVAEPLDPAKWEPLRAETPRRAVATETADVLTTLRTGPDKRYDGVIRYGVSRFKVGDRHVTEFTVPINLVPGPGVTGEQLTALRERARAGIETLINKRHGLPNGDQLHVRVEFTEDRLTGENGEPGYRAYDVVARDDERTTQTTWRPDATPEELAHELLHYLGAPDEEHDQDRVFLSKEDDGTTGVVTGDGGIMGADVVEPGQAPRLLPRHAWQIQHVLESQLGSGHRLTDPGQDDLPGVPPSLLTDVQRTAMTRERREVFAVGGDTVSSNLIEAIARTVAPDSPSRQAELRELGVSLPHATPEEVAHALGVRLRMLTEGGTTVRLGPSRGETARVVLSSSGDFLATHRVPEAAETRPPTRRAPVDHTFGESDGGGQAENADPGIDDYTSRYEAVFAGLPNLVSADDGARLGELSRIAEGGRLENHVEAVLRSREISTLLGRIDQGLGTLTEPDIRERVRSLVNDALLVTSLTPARERDSRDNSRLGLGTVRDRRVVRPVSIDRLRQLLGDLAVNLEAGRDPFTALGSTVQGIDYRPDQELPSRLARLGLTNLTPPARATLQDDRLFQALLENPAAMTEALFAATGHDEQHFMNSCEAAATNSEIRGLVPTIAGLLLAGRGVATHVEQQLEGMRADQLTKRDRPFGRTIGALARERVAKAGLRFDGIEKQAMRLATAAATDPAALEEWAELTTQWGRTLQKLAAVVRLDRRDGSSVPVLTKKIIPGAWELSAPLLLPLAVDRPMRRATGLDDLPYRESVHRHLAPAPRENYRGRLWTEPEVPLSPGLEPDPGVFWQRIRSGNGVRVGTESHQMFLKAAEVGGERMFVLGDPKKSNHDYLSFGEFARWAERNDILVGRDVLVDRAVVVPSRPDPAPEPDEAPAPETGEPEPPGGLAVDVLAEAESHDAGIWLTDPSADPTAREAQRNAVLALRGDPRFFTVVAHVGPGGVPEFRGRPITPEVMVEVLARLAEDGVWTDGRTLRFVACGLGSPDVHGYVSTVLHGLADENLETDAYAGDTAVWSTPGRENGATPGELVVASQVGFHRDGRPVVTGDGQWLHFRFAERAEIEVTEHGAYLVAGDEDPPVFRKAPGGFDVVPTTDGDLIEKTIPGSLPFGTETVDGSGVGTAETVRANLAEFAEMVAAQPVPPPVEVRGPVGDSRLSTIARTLRSTLTRSVRLSVLTSASERDVVVSTVVPHEGTGEAPREFEIYFEQGRKDFPSAGRSTLDAAAVLVASAVREGDPTVSVVGYGNGSVTDKDQARRTGQARAETVAKELSAAIIAKLPTDGSVKVPIVDPTSQGSDLGSEPRNDLAARRARRRAVISVELNPGRPLPTADETPVLRPSPGSRNQSETSTRSTVTVNSVVVDDLYPGRILPRDIASPRQRKALRIHGAEPLFIGNEAPHITFRKAVAAGLSDRAPLEYKRVTRELDEFAKNHPGDTDLARLADAAGVRVHVLRANGTWRSYGPKTGRPVHLLLADLDGEDNYLGLRENVHIGRPHVSYPGSSVLVTGDERKVVHRGEFEIETVKGKHYVRLYTAVLAPAKRASEYKDVHQEKSGKVVPFSGQGRDGAKEVFWVGGGRPLRAVQWISKYEKDVNRVPDVQSALRSFLVPLGTFLAATRQATVESRSDGNKLSMNVDQNGDTNQFGLRGLDFTRLRERALDGSLITYTHGANESLMPEAAGRQEDIADLYSRLGLSPDFKSERLGKDVDPWFTWSAGDRKYFRNDPAALRGLAKTLSNHYHTWKESPEAFFSPAADAIPGVEGDPAADSPFRRAEEMNVFLNTRGPGKAAVDQLAAKIDEAIDTVVRAQAPDGVPVGPSEFKDVVLNQIKASLQVPQQVLNAATAAVAANTVRYQNLEALRTALLTHPRISLEAAKIVAQAVEASLETHLGPEAIEQEFTQQVLDVIRETVRARFEQLRSDWGGDLDALSQAKRGYLSGARGEAFTKAVIDELTGTLAAQFAQPDLTISRAAFAAQLKEQAVPKAIRPVTKSKLVDLEAKDLKKVFDARLGEVATALTKELKSKNVAKLASAESRTAVANAVGPRVRELELAAKSFAKVTRQEADEFMDLLPQFATQAEIGSLVATDERRIKADFDTRQTRLDGDHIEGEPFSNDYGRWLTEHVLGFTWKHEPHVFDAHQRIGRELTETIRAELRAPHDRSAKTILDALVTNVDEGVTDPRGGLARKFAETVKPNGGPHRTGTETKPNTFSEHAQMVINQYLKITQGHEDAGRFVKRDAIVKAILFHDMEKVNSKNQYGDAQVQHDKEPEHRGALEQMRRYEGLWSDRREFELVCRFVDSDPFGYYFREIGVDTKGKKKKGAEKEGTEKKSADKRVMDKHGVYGFVRDLAHWVKRPDGTAPNARDVRNLFREFHQYYQADFSSYSAHARFVHDDDDAVWPGYDKLIGMAEAENVGHVLVPGEHRFAYSSADRESGKLPYEKKYRDLAALFDEAVLAEEQASAEPVTVTVPDEEDAPREPGAGGFDSDAVFDVLVPSPGIGTSGLRDITSPDDDA